jgi:hypothetical protein
LDIAKNNIDLLLAAFFNDFRQSKLASALALQSVTSRPVSGKSNATLPAAT